MAESLNKKGKIGVVTYYNGNYGSILQSFATCYILNKLSFEPRIVVEKQNRFFNLIRFAFRCVKYPRYIKTFFNLRKKSYLCSSLLTEKDTELMNSFVNEKLPLMIVTRKELKKAAYSNDFVSFLSGSDQIWGGHQYIVDKKYFLRFAPYNKRVAWSVSFGSDDVAPYNKALFKSYINDYKFISVREDSGVKLVKELTEKNAELLLDPVFLLTADEWCSIFEKSDLENFVFCYFLDEIADETVEQINSFCKKNDVKPIVFGPVTDTHRKIKGEKICGSPSDFVSLIKNADCVFTDSFHALSFSLIMHTPFYVYSRNYANKIDQSSRVLTLLKKANLSQFFNSEVLDNELYDFSQFDKILENERDIMMDYLKTSVSD